MSNIPLGNQPQAPAPQQPKFTINQPAASLPPAAANPLSKYFRQPVIYYTLPSGGRWWPKDAKKVSETGELGVYPMTSKDEVLLRTPDALMNGQGMVDVIRSCVPDIVDPWKIPSVDVDATLIAIRIASYGHMMDFEGKCPHCNEEHTYSMDLRPILDSIRAPDFDHIFEVKSLLVKFLPQTYYHMNKNNRTQFEIQKIGQAIDNIEDDEVKAAEAVTQMNRLLDINLEMLAECTEWIAPAESPGDKVSNKQHIMEFYRNVDGTLVGTLQNEYADLMLAGGIKPQRTHCPGCNDEMDLAVTFDYANFFGPGS